MTIKTILFDLDGTLIDTHELIMASYRYTIKQYADREYTEDELQEFIGPPLRDALMTVRPDKIDELMDTYRKHNHEHHDALIKEFEGVYETLEFLEEQGIQIAVVTTKIKSTALKGLKLTRLDRFFDVVIGLDDVDNAKPHPEPVLKAMELLNADPMTTMMVGDNYHDIEAGKNAGTLTAGVAWSHKGKAFMESLKPDYLLDEMTDLIEIVKNN